MLDIPSISAIVAALGVIVGVVFTVLQLRDLVKTRQTDLVMRLYSIFGGKEHMEAYYRVITTEFRSYEEFAKKYPLGTPEATALDTFCAFYEGIGVLLHRKLIDIGLVDDLFTTPITSGWEKIGPVIKEARERWKRPQIWEWFEYLYNEMQKREPQLTQKTA